MVTGRERRKTPRHRQRLTVRYSASGSKSTGFTEDISAGGLFVVSRKLVQAGTMLTLEIQLPDSSVVQVIGAVTRRRRVPTAVQSFLSNGFAVSIKQAPEVWYEFVLRLPQRTPRTKRARAP